MRIGYGRVSTRDQNADAQHDALAAAGCDPVFVDKASGTLASRPELSKALTAARAGDQLVVTKLDRLGRSLEHLIALPRDLGGRGVDLVVLDQGIDTTTAAGLARRPIKDLRFVVAGAFVADCFVNTQHLPAWGQTREARSIRMSPGGKALNQAVALARLGAQVSAVGVVGNDGSARDVLAALVRERVDVSWVESRDGVATTVCLYLVGDEGESAIVWHIDEDVAVTPENVNAAGSAFEGADAALITFEMPVPTISAAIEAAQNAAAWAVRHPGGHEAMPSAEVGHLVGGSAWRLIARDPH